MSDIENKARRRQEILDHFETLAPTNHKYRKRFNYYWKDIVKYCNYFIHEDDTVLEVGCGSGETMAQLNGSKKVGIDFSPAMIAEAKKHYPNEDFRLLDAENLGELNEKFDVIVLSNVMGYFENVLDVLEAVKRVSHDRTRIVVAYYNYIWEPILRLGEVLGIKRKSPRQSWMSRIDLENMLYLGGFETYRENRRTLLPINIPLLAFILNQFFARLPIFNWFCLNQFIFARPLPKEDEETATKYTTTVVIPARNESGNIEEAILRVPKFGKDVEIIFVEGNSTDDTWEEIQRVYKKYSRDHGGDYNIKITQQDGKGKGDAVRKGYAMATGDILMILDADLTVLPEDLPKFYHALASGKGEFINGSRLVYPMEKEAMRFLNTLGNKFFSVAFSWLLEQPIKDSLCGTKVMFREDYIKLVANRKFFGEFDPFGDFDLLFGAYKLNLKIIDLPIRYHERTYGDTNISRFRHGLILLRMVMYAAGKIKFW